MGPNFLKSFARHFLSFIFPPLCVRCGLRLKNEGMLCESCRGQIQMLVPPYCFRCGQALFSSLCACSIEWPFVFSMVRALSPYNLIMQDLIRLFKYEKFSRLGFLLAELLGQVVDKKFFEKVDFITTVPLHHSRLRERGYNQSQLIGEILAQKMRIPFLSFLLKRRRKTISQTKFNRQDRKKNMDGVFQISKKGREILRKFQQGTVLLVDDVITTGATLNACAKILLEDGAVGEVRVAVLARA